MELKPLLALLVAAISGYASPIVSRDSEPFVGAGRINVVTLKNKQVGCLTDTMAFTADTSACATFNIVKTTYPAEPPYGPPPPSYAISTSAGPCGDPFQSGSQYEEGGNRILLCGDGSDSANSYWSVSSGDNALIGVPLLQDDNDDIDQWNTIDGKPPSGSQAKTLQQDLGVGAEDGTSYALTWTAQ